MSDTNRGRFPTARPAAYQPLIVILAAFAAGITCDAHWPFPAWCWFCASLGCFAVWWKLWTARFDSLAGAPLLLAIAAAGAAWHHDRWSLFSADDLGRRAGQAPQPVCVIALVVSAPRWSPAPAPHPLASFPRRDETEVLVEIERLRSGEHWEPARGLARLLVAGQLNGLSCGDRLQILAHCSAPRRPMNPGEFDQAAYQRNQRRLCQLNAKSVDAVTRVATGPAWSWQRAIDDLRASGHDRLRRCVGPRHAGLAAAILLGTREQLDDELERGFFVTGLAHLLAISGLNVAIFAYGFWSIARLGFFPRRLALILAGALAVFYALLTDAQPPVVRAAILVVCVCVARFLGRQGLAFNTLAASGILVLLVNPTYLFQTGTQLSFLAVAVLCFQSRGAAPHRGAGDSARLGTASAGGGTGDEENDPLDQLLARSRPWWWRAALALGWWLVEACWTSARVWLVSLPLVVARFHLLSPIALPLNPVVMLPTAVALYAGFGVLVLGDAPLGIGRGCGWLCHMSLEVIARAISLGECVPGNHVWTPAPPVWWLWFYFAGLASAPLAYRQGLPPRWLWAAFVVWMAVGVRLIGGAAKPPSGVPSPLECTFVAVGHGTAVVVRLPDGRTVLYDCGRLGWPPTAARWTAGVLWSRGVRHIDAVILSHADTDHYNALPDLLDRFTVGVVYVSPVMFADDAPPLEALRASLERADVPCRNLAAGDVLLAGLGVRFEALHPLPRPDRSTDNAHSIVVSIEYLGHRILLPGDLESPGLEEVLAEEPRHCDVIMAPHHGSVRSDPGGFAQWTTPRHVVVSDSGTRDGHALRETYERAGARLWHTAQHGAVTVRIDTSGVHVSAFVE